MQGILQRFREDKGYGFIKISGRASDVFIGHKEAKKHGIRTLIVGTIFDFDVKIRANRRPEAVNIKVIEALTPPWNTPEVAPIPETEIGPASWEDAIADVVPLGRVR